MVPMGIMYMITVESDESVAFVGVSIYTASGSKLDDRVLRVNHPPMSDYVNGNTDWFVWANNNNNDNNDNNDNKTVVLLDFDQVPTEESDLRFSIMDEYGWTPTTPLAFADNGMNDYILSKGWSLSIYQGYSDPETMISHGNNEESYNDFKTYIDDAFSKAYDQGFFSPIQWSATRNYIGSNLIKGLKTKGIPLIRGNYFDPSKDIEDDGRIVKLQANPMSKSGDLTNFKSIISTGKYKVINIFAHRILPDNISATDPICTPESVYRSFCEYLKSLEEDGSVLVTNATKWFSKAFPDRVRAYEDVWIRAMYKRLSK